MKYKVLSILLAAALLLCGCSLPQTAPPEDQMSATPPQTGQEQPEAPKVPQVPRAQLPASGGIEWNNVSEHATGTGGHMPAEVQSAIWQAWEFFDYEYQEPEAGEDLSRSISISRLTGLTNTVLQQRINETMERTVAAFIADDAPVETARQKVRALGEGVTCQMNDNIYTNVYIVGQILSVSVCRELYISYTGADGDDFPSEGYSEMEAWRYSLRDGSELLLSDLFSDDCDYAALLRQLVTQQLSDYELKRPFRGLPADYSKVIFSGGAMQLWIPGDNPYIDTVFGYPTYVYLPLDQMYSYLPLLQGDPTEYLLPMS